LRRGERKGQKKASSKKKTKVLRGRRSSVEETHESRGSIGGEKNDQGG